MEDLSPRVSCFEALLIRCCRCITPAAHNTTLRRWIIPWHAGKREHVFFNVSWFSFPSSSSVQHVSSRRERGELSYPLARYKKVFMFLLMFPDFLFIDSYVYPARGVDIKKSTETSILILQMNVPFPVNSHFLLTFLSPEGRQNEGQKAVNTVTLKRYACVHVFVCCLILFLSTVIVVFMPEEAPQGIKQINKSPVLAAPFD